jgi:hypothetical protein
VEGQEELVVEKITKTRWQTVGNKTNQQWLVHWKGFSDAEATWEDYTNISTSGLNESWAKFQEKTLQAEQKLMNRVKALQQGCQLRQIYNGRLCALRQGTHSSENVICHMLINAEHNAKAHKIDNDGIVQPMSLTNKPLKLLVLGYKTAMVNTLKSILAEGSVLVTVGRHQDAIHNCSVAHWVSANTYNKHYPSVLCDQYPKHYFDLVVVNPTQSEIQGGEGIALRKTACLWPAVEYIHRQDPTHWYVHESEPTLREAMHRSDKVTWFDSHEQKGENKSV